MTPAEFKRTWRNRPLMRYAIMTWDGGFRAYWAKSLDIAAQRRRVMQSCRSSVCDICREKGTHCTAAQQANQMHAARKHLAHIRKERLNPPSWRGRMGYLP